MCENQVWEGAVELAEYWSGATGGGSLGRCEEGVWGAVGRVFRVLWGGSLGYCGEGFWGAVGREFRVLWEGCLGYWLERPLGL